MPFKNKFSFEKISIRGNIWGECPFKKMYSEECTVIIKKKLEFQVNFVSVFLATIKEKCKTKYLYFITQNLISLGNK